MPGPLHVRPKQRTDLEIPLRPWVPSEGSPNRCVCLYVAGLEFLLIKNQVASASLFQHPELFTLVPQSLSFSSEQEMCAFYLDSFLTFLIAKGLLQAPTPSLCLSVQGRWTPTLGDFPRAGLGLQPCYAVSSGRASQQSQDGRWPGEARSLVDWRLEMHTQGETWLRFPHFFHTEHDYREVLPYGPRKIPAKSGFGRPGPEPKQT